MGVRVLCAHIASAQSKRAHVQYVAINVLSWPWTQSLLEVNRRVLRVYHASVAKCMEAELGGQSWGRENCSPFLNFVCVLQSFRLFQE